MSAATIHGWGGMAKPAPAPPSTSDLSKWGWVASAVIIAALVGAAVSTRMRGQIATSTQHRKAGTSQTVPSARTSAARRTTSAAA